jgi:hypothetical protein
MAFPATPQDLRVEAYLGAAWRDITSDVRDDPGITIERGATAEGSTSAPSPSTCSFTLDNSSGNYTPRNPAGQYFGGLGRNTPVRVTLGLTTDDFARTVASGWGVSADGLTWAGGASGTGSAAVGSGVATHTQSTAAGFRLLRQVGANYSAVDVAVTVSLAVTNITGGAVEPANLVLRYTTTGYSFVRLSITTAEAITIGIFSSTTGELAEAVTTGYTHTSAQALRVRAQVEGDSIRAKVWPLGSAEPVGWQVEAIDPDMAPLGEVGIRSGVASGNTNIPVVFSYDDFEVRSPRWAGEVAEWPVSADTSGRDVTSAVTASGLLRRQSQGAAPLRSAMYRAHLSPYLAAPLAYWPMEDGERASSLGSAIARGRAMIIPPDLEMASSNSFAASEPCVTFGASTTPLTGTVRGYTSTGTIVTYVLLHVPSGGLTNQARLLTVWLGGSSIARWIVYYATGGNLQVRAFDSDATELHDSGSVGFNVNDRPLLMRFALTQDGSDVDYDLSTASVGEVAVGGISGTVTGRALGRVTSVAMGGSISLDGLAAGHLAVKSVDDYGLFHRATQAWAGETAGERVLRLCAEQAVPVVFDGLYYDTEPMGAQSASTLLDLVEECAAADGGLLAEPAGVLGVAYRTRVALYSQTTRATIDQTVGQVLPPLEPVDDDRYIRNQVTVTRDGGASATASQTSGPLAIAEPPAGVGLYDTAVTLNLGYDEQTDAQAEWRVGLGTIDEPRYPSVRVSLAKTPALRAAVLSVGLGDRLGVTHNRPSRYGQRPIDGLVLGYTERLSRYEHEFDWTLAPAAGYAVGAAAADSGDTGEFVLRADTDGSTVVSGVAAGGTSMSVATPSGPLWTTVADDFPLQVTVGGIYVTVTNITGASSPQTFAIAPAPYPLAANAAVSVVSPVVGL